jgi:hypothetical protein
VPTLPFTSVSLVRSMEGSIPECVWSMYNLMILNIAGNGLRGRIGSVSSMPSLLSLTLSHNHLGGEIPLWLQEKSLFRLDLSHNKLTGDLDGFKHQDGFNISSLSFGWGNQSSNRNLKLIVNRLSGDLPSSFGRYADLDILSGNLFGCDHLPKNDENSESLSCGSEQYDQSMITMGGLLGMMVCSLAMYHLLCLSITSDGNKTRRLVLVGKVGLFDRLSRYHQSYPSESNHRQSQGEANHPSHPLQSTASFESLLFRLMRLACVLTALCLLLTFPVYVLKQLDQESTSQEEETQYVTHTHMYNWLWTMAYVSGTTPAIILLVGCFVCLSYFTVVMNRLGGKEDLPPRSTSLFPSLKKVTDSQSHFMRTAAVWIVFLANIAVVGTVNGLYIWSTLLDVASDVRLWIQLSFALFSSLWSVILRRGLPSHIKGSRYGVWLVICLNVMNTVLIPCAVTALSTPSCYQVSMAACLNSAIPHLSR